MQILSFIPRRVWNKSGSTLISVWTDVIHDLSDFLDSSSVLIKFEFYNECGDSAEVDWYIDDVKITVSGHGFNIDTTPPADFSLSNPGDEIIVDIESPSLCWNTAV